MTWTWSHTVTDQLRWRKWFAWYPVKVCRFAGGYKDGYNTQRVWTSLWVWGQYVETREVWFESRPKREYRPLQPVKS